MGWWELAAAARARVVGLVAVARVVVAEEEPVGRISEWRVGVAGAATWAVSAACPAGA